MYRCPAYVREEIDRLDKMTDDAEVKVWKANKKYKDACNKLEYITLRLTRISKEDLKHATVDYSRHRAFVKSEYLKLKLDQAQENLVRLTREKLQVMVTAYKDPKNFLDGKPYLE
jgi:hypothetical protein